METLCLIASYFLILRSIAFVGVFSHFVKGTLDLFLKIPMKSTCQQTIVCVKNIVVESFFWLLSYNQMVFDQRFKMDFYETIKSRIVYNNAFCRNKISFKIGASHLFYVQDPTEEAIVLLEARIQNGLDAPNHCIHSMVSCMVIGLSFNLISFSRMGNALEPHNKFDIVVLLAYE